MTAKRLLDRKPVRVQVTLDGETLEFLDRLIDDVPDLGSRSAAIRYAARTAAHCLDLENLKEKRRAN